MVSKSTYKVEEAASGNGCKLWNAAISLRWNLPSISSPLFSSSTTPSDLGFYPGHHASFPFLSIASLDPSSPISHGMHCSPTSLSSGTSMSTPHSTMSSNLASYLFQQQSVVAMAAAAKAAAVSRQAAAAVASSLNSDNHTSDET